MSIFRTAFQLLWLWFVIFQIFTSKAHSSETSKDGSEPTGHRVFSAHWEKAPQQLFRGHEFELNLNIHTPSHWNSIPQSAPLEGINLKGASMELLFRDGQMQADGQYRQHFRYRFTHNRSSHLISIPEHTLRWLDVQSDEILSFKLPGFQVQVQQHSPPLQGPMGLLEKPQQQKKLNLSHWILPSLCLLIIVILCYRRYRYTEPMNEHGEQKSTPQAFHELQGQQWSKALLGIDELPLTQAEKSQWQKMRYGSSASKSEIDAMAKELSERYTPPAIVASDPQPNEKTS
jgi:hypothetical protein